MQPSLITDSRGVEKNIPLPRTAISITLSVWKAMFLREAISRLSAQRAAWLWLLLEPIVHILIMLAVFTVIRQRVVAGADTAIWLLVGMTGFFTARNIFSRATEAINANRALFAYRQILPVDTVLVRAALEGFLGVLVALLLLAGFGLMGYEVIPHNPLLALSAFVGLLLCGLGMGLLLSVTAELLPELGKVTAFFFTPLYFLSGVIFPLAMIPPQYRKWVFYIPFTHGIELLRGGFFPLYHVLPEANARYLYGFGLISIFFGFLLHIRYADKLRAK
jgi:capsular polysaccharide transport system permease protein